MGIVMFVILFSSAVLQGMETPQIPEFPIELQKQITGGSDMLSSLKQFLTSKLCEIKQYTRADCNDHPFSWFYRALSCNGLTLPKYKDRAYCSGHEQIIDSYLLAVGDGVIARYHRTQFLRHLCKKKIHDGEIVFIWANAQPATVDPMLGCFSCEALPHSNVLISGGEDGFVRLWQNNSPIENAVMLKEFDFQKTTGSLPQSIFHIATAKLFLIESAAHDYCFFNENLDPIAVFHHADIERLNIPAGKTLVSEPAILKELITLNNGVSLAEYRLLNEIELAVKKQKTYIFQQEKHLSNYPHIKKALHDAGYIGTLKPD